MLEQVLQEIHNWFQTDIYRDEYTIQDGSITLPFLQDGQYFRIVGSVFNDGLYLYSSEMKGLTDEIFEGAIWAMAVPKAVVELSEDIASWREKYGAVIESPYTSESFGGYVYSKSSGAGDGTGSGGWQSAFRARLKPYRKLREI